MRNIKDLFATPKKTILTSTCIVALVIAIGTGTVFAAEETAKSKSIGRENAESIAFADAGIDPSAVSVLRTDFDRENGQYVYEIEFYVDGVAYDYVLDANSGEVLARDVVGQPKPVSTTAPTTVPTTVPPASEPSTGNGGAQNSRIGLDAAKKKALADAGLSASDVTYTKGQLDYEDGVQVYDIEFYTATKAYDYEVHATTGAIVEKSVEKIYKPAPPASAETTTQQTAQGSYIGVDKAKSIAVSHAGVSSAQVTFQKAKLENEDGSFVYDVEFYVGTREYEYTIDAISGHVLEFDSELDTDGYD